MAKATSIYDKSADEWTDKEIEVEKLRLERDRAKSEGSIGRRYGTVILSAVVGLVGTGLTYYTNAQADMRAQKAAEEETARTLAQNAVRVYFENPNQFDLAKEEGIFNLRLLAATAPGTTTETLLNRIQGQVIANAVTAQTAAVDAAIAAPAAAAAANPAAAAAPAPTAPQAVQQVADDVRYAAIQNAPSLVENATLPSDFTVYVQYGSGSADRAKNVQAVLGKMGFQAPGTEEVKVGVTTAQVRYFRPTQEKIARDLASNLGGVLGGTPQVQYVGANRKLPDGILEVWLPGTTPVTAANSAALGKAFGYVQNQMRQEAIQRRLPASSAPLAPAAPAPSTP
jgi:hypothetical protein